MIDEGECDWKIISIDANDPMASKMSDISDVDVHMPNLLKMTIHWFTNYKVRLSLKMIILLPTHYPSATST